MCYIKSFSFEENMRQNQFSVRGNTKLSRDASWDEADDIFYKPIISKFLVKSINAFFILLLLYSLSLSITVLKTEVFMVPKLINYIGETNCGCEILAPLPWHRTKVNE